MKVSDPSLRTGALPILLFALTLALFQVDHALAKEPVAPSENGWLDPEGIKGKLIVHGGGKLTKDVRDKFLEWAGGKEARLVVIPTADDRADDETTQKRAASEWESDVAKVDVLHTRDRTVADSDDFVSPLKEATGVWFGGGSQSKIVEVYSGTKVENELVQLLARGGVIGGSSAGAACQCKTMIAQGNPVAEVKTGFDFLPGAVIDQHFRERNRQPRLIGVLKDHPQLFGLGIDEATAVAVQGRRMVVLGDSVVTVLHSSGGGRDASSQEFPSGTTLDLTALRRASRDRVEEPFPIKEVRKPIVESGSLVIVGGGGMTKEMTERFIELAGGPESKIIVLPTADESVPPRPEEGNFLKAAGAKNVVVLSASKRGEVTDPKFREEFADARGIWFGGGRQWRFVDAYERTGAVDLFHTVLKNGGVIGGSSAGASIQAEYMVRGHPLGNTVMMAEGYERGFGFLPGAAVDQHFTQRNREKDLLGVVEKYPQILGIGIDETTAIIVRKGIAEVVGKHQTHFYRRKPDLADPLKFSLKAGERFDLIEHAPTEQLLP